MILSQNIIVSVGFIIFNNKKNKNNKNKVNAKTSFWKFLS